MFNDTSATNNSATYVKVAGHPGLYRHSRSGRYYGFKKLNGKPYERSLKTTDRKIAERRLRDWVRNLDAVDRELERTTLRGLLQKFVAVNQGKSAKTQATNTSIIVQINRTWPGGIDIEVRNIKPSHLDQWLALQENRLKNTSYNRYTGLLRQLFDIALRDRIIADSPFNKISTSWKRPSRQIVSRWSRAKPREKFCFAEPLLIQARHVWRQTYCPGRHDFHLRERKRPIILSTTPTTDLTF